MNLYVISDKQGAGKTFITAGIAATMQSLGYSVGYYNPIQTSALNQNGFITSQDIVFVKKIDPNVNTSVSYNFQDNSLPILAAQKENVIVQPEVLVKDFLNLRKISDIVLVEGNGGLITPLCDDMETTDFMKAMQTSLLLVVEPSHEALEKILLTLNYAKHSGVSISGVILNRYIKSSDINISKLPVMIESYSGIPVVGMVEYQPKISPSGLIDTILHSVDLETIFKMKIPRLNN